MNQLSNFSFKIFVFIFFFLVFSSDVQAISFYSGNTYGVACFDNNLKFHRQCGDGKATMSSYRKVDSKKNDAFCANRTQHFAGNSASYVKDTNYSSLNTCVYYLPKASDATKYTKHSDGDCSKIVGYIIQQAYVYDRDASQLKKWFLAQASIWIYLGKFTSKDAGYRAGNTANFGSNSITDIWNNNTTIRKILRRAWKKYAADNENIDVRADSNVNFSVSVPDTQFHYSSNTSSCGKGSYITREITITNHEERPISIEIPVTFDGVQLCEAGSTQCWFKGGEEILKKELNPGESLQLTLSTNYILEGNVTLFVTASFKEKADASNKIKVYDSVRYEKSGYQGMIIQKTKEVNKNGKAQYEHEKEIKLRFTQTPIYHITCPNIGSSLSDNIYPSSKDYVSKVCAGDPNVTSSNDYSVNFSGCSCMSIDLGDSRSVNVLVYETVSFRYGHLTPNIIYAGGGFEFANGSNGISTAYSGNIVWNYADYYGSVSNNVPYYYNPNGDYNARNVQALIESKIRDMIKNNVTLNFSTYDSNNQENTARVLVHLSLNLEGSISYDAGGRRFGFSSNEIQMNPAYLSQDGMVSYVKNDTKYPVSGGNKYYVPLKFKTTDNNFPFDIVNTNLSATGKNNFLIEAPCHVHVDENYYLYQQDGVRYRSIDVSNPFPRATKKSELPLNWQDWYTNSSNALRIKNTFDNYPNKPLYKIILTDDKISEMNKISTLYTDWSVHDHSGINSNGESVFVTQFFDIRSSGNRSYCKLGQFDASCDQG